MAKQLLTLSQRLKRRGIAGSSRYWLGHEPYFRLFVDDRMLYNQPLRPDGIRPKYRSGIYRIDAEVGFDVVPSCTVYITGDQAAKLVKEHMPRGGIVRCEVGYDDIAVSEHPANKRRVIFEGEVLQARGPRGYPTEVMVECSGSSWRMNQSRDAAPEEAADGPAYITSRMAATDIGLTANFKVPEAKRSAEGVTEQQSLKLIDFVDEWSRTQGLHWLDNGDKTVYFFLPSNRFDFLRQAPINWTLPMKGDPTKPQRAAVLSEWDVSVKFIDTPGTLVSAYTAPRQPSGQKKTEQLEVTVEGGDPERIMVIEGATKKQLEYLAEDYLWATATGTFACHMGLPILPMDIVTATDGPEGAEEVMDRPFQVVHSHFTSDLRGLRVSGNVRGVIEN